MRSIDSPNAGDIVVDVITPVEGGLGVTSVSQLKTALGLIDKATIGVAGGIVPLDSSGRIPTNLVPVLDLVTVSVSGPTELIVGTSGTYLITNYDMFTTYEVAAINGIISRNKDVITYIAPNTVMVSGFTVNGKVFNPTITAAAPQKPSITSPTDNAATVALSYTLTSSPFVALGDNSTHLTSDWQIATDVNFTNIVKSATEDSSNKVSWAVTGLIANTGYYARVRYKGSNGNSSSWSNTTTFTTANQFAVNATISASTTNYSMRSAAVAAGWDQATPLKMTVTVNNGVVIGSTTTAAFSFDTGAPYPVGSELALNNNGSILGKGGDAGTSGGPALRAQVVLAVTNNGTIGGGGGGGGQGAGGQYVANPEIYGVSGTWYTVGGGGGGGQGSPGGSGGGTNGTGNGPYAYYRGAAGGGSGTINAAGSGGLGAYGHEGAVAPNTYIAGGSGGSGGTLGQPGSSGENAQWSGENYGTGNVMSSTSPMNFSDTNYPPSTSGGAGGLAVQGNSNIAWIATGTRLGSIT